MQQKIKEAEIQCKNNKKQFKKMVSSLINDSSDEEELTVKMRKKVMREKMRSVIDYF